RRAEARAEEIAAERDAAGERARVAEAALDAQRGHADAEAALRARADAELAAARAELDRVRAELTAARARALAPDELRALLADALGSDRSAPGAG
ncbi:MAG TPA: hypothetical protein VD813_07675, partial [Pseudonocardia sp.]|nr:hypothetical protein [Pseudonocardia sp.]